MNTLSHVLHTIDEFVWGPCMLLLFIGTGIILTVRTRFLLWREFPRAIRNSLRRSTRKADSVSGASGGISPFAALMTSLAATIGTGNIVGVSTALVLGGPGALVWMWIAALFGIASKFGECMLAVKYRERSAAHSPTGGPMYTLKKAFPDRRIGAALGFLFALFAVVSSFGIGNMTQANSVADALSGTFSVPPRLTGALLTVLTLTVVVGGIRSISRIASVLVPSMALLYIVAGLLVLLTHYQNIPDSLTTIVTMAFSTKAFAGGCLGTAASSMLRAMRYGVARGVFSNEAGMGSAAITAASAASDHPVRQGLLNMTGIFWDTIVVCTITGLCIMSSGVLGSTEIIGTGCCAAHSGQIVFFPGAAADNSVVNGNVVSGIVERGIVERDIVERGIVVYDIAAFDNTSLFLVFNEDASAPLADGASRPASAVMLTKLPAGDTTAPQDPAAGSDAAPRSAFDSPADAYSTPSGGTDTPSHPTLDSPADAYSTPSGGTLTGTWRDADGYVCTFRADGTYTYAKPLTGASLTIAAFRSALGDAGAYFLTVSIALFAFSTILGWEYLGERAWEYLIKTPKYNRLYRVVFSLVVYAGATAALNVVWDFSNIANALMSVPNLICLLALSGEISKDLRAYLKKSPKTEKIRG
ncbi:MAG: amino acid carrier protein [bacterium]|nr:amino acid carrier protein [bacterium]